MAVEKVGIYRKWLDPVPKDENGNPVPRIQWPRKRRYHWIVRWYGTTGKRYGEVFETRKEAERHTTELQRQLSSGRGDKPRRIALHDFIREHERVMKGQVACGTLEEHVRALNMFAKHVGGDIELSKIQPHHAEAFLAQRLAGGCSTSTANKDLGTLRRVFNLAVEPRGYLAEGGNPFAKLKKRKIAQPPLRYVSVEEYRALTRASGSLWWRGLVSLAYGSGLRRNEILHLTWADVDFENHRIAITAKKETSDIIEWQPKDRENRVVPISEETEQLLANLQEDTPVRHPYVFISPRRLQRIKERRKTGKWDSRRQIINNMGRQFEAILSKAGVAECTLHDLRRSAITNWAQKLPIQVVQQLAGHSDISTTRKYYLAVRPEDLTSASRVLNSLLAGATDD